MILAPAIERIVLVMETVAALAVAFLALLSCAVIKRAIVSFIHHASGLDLETATAIAQCASTGVYVYVIIHALAESFQQHKQALCERYDVHFLACDHPLSVLTSLGCARLGLLHAPSASGPVDFALIHLMVLSLFAWIQQQSDTKIVAWSSMGTAFQELPAHVLLERLLLVPIQEELLFRGFLLQLALNRLRKRVLPSAVVTSLLFATVHLVFNARRLSPSDSHAFLFYQVGVSFIIGTFLSLRVVLSGSLLECIVLHCINNAFALAIDQRFISQLREPIVIASGTTDDSTPTLLPLSDA